MSSQITIVVPCHNAVGRVDDTLEALAQQTADISSYEVLVIDNNSADFAALHVLIERCSALRPVFRLIRESRPGLNHVRARGAAEACSPYVMFLDDDAVPLCSYVKRLCYALAEHKPDVIGGSLIGFPEVPLERHHDFACAGWWSLRHYGTTSRWLGAGEYFLGANIGARTDLLREHGFDAALDRKGTSLVGGGELWLGDSCYRRWYCADTPVFHKITIERTQIPYLGKRIACNFSRRVLPGDWRTWLRYLAQTFTSATKTWLLTVGFRLRLWREAQRVAAEIREKQK